MLIVAAREADRQLLLEGARLARERDVSEAVDLGAATTALGQRTDIAIVACGAELAVEIARAAPGALLIVTAQAGQLSLGAAAVADGVAFDMLALPAEAEAVAASVRRARELCESERAAAAAENDLAIRRAELDHDVAALVQKEADLPRLDRLRAELSTAVMSELQERLDRTPSHLDAATGSVDDQGMAAALGDGTFAARSALRMVDDLLDVARADSAPIAVSLRTVELDPFLAEVVGAVARVASDYEAVVEVARSGPAADCRTDPVLLGRALENLLEGGLRRSRRGRLLLEAEAGLDRVRFSVVDVGGPVPERLLGNPWSRLARLESSSLQRGAALGFCRVVAEALGGSVRAEGEPRGLRMTIEVPRFPPDAAPQAASR